MIDSPFSGAPEKAPRWDLTGTKVCGGGNRVSWFSAMFLGYKSIYRRSTSVELHGAHECGRRAYPPGRAFLPCGRPAEFHTSTPSLLDCFWSKKDHREGFILFGLRLVFILCKTKKQEKIKTGTGLWVNRLVPKII